MRRDQLPIGLFDSGVGGLTVLTPCAASCPARITCSPETPPAYPTGPKAENDCPLFSSGRRQLIGQRIKLLVIACNTATAAGFRPARNMARHAHHRRDRARFPRRLRSLARCDIAVIATESTIRSGAYAEAILRRRPEAQVRSLAAPVPCAGRRRLVRRPHRRRRGFTLP
ncbi:MAG: hypothetical protein ACLSHC_01085 [Bilophila wadsworthia]